MVSPEDILHFWFVQAGPSKWWKPTDAFDAEIRRRFEMPAAEAADDLLQKRRHPWQSAPSSALALILMLDQFPRNMYRGTPGAFAWDPLALGAARRAVEKGHDLKTDQSRRAFFYMPFMHAEDLAAQNTCVELVDGRLEDENTLFHAKAHRIMIEKFGRFPHRNAILGRATTDDERAYLGGGGYTP